MAAPEKCLLVTRASGVEKTTPITRVFKALKASNPNLKVEGFYTREIREVGGQRVGFEVVTGWSHGCACIVHHFHVKEDMDLYVIDEIVARVKNHPGAKIYKLIAGNRESIR